MIHYHIASQSSSGSQYEPDYGVTIKSYESKEEFTKKSTDLLRTGGDRYCKFFTTEGPLTVLKRGLVAE